jgi:Domain of Unknown Function (DUF928)
MLRQHRFYSCSLAVGLLLAGLKTIGLEPFGRQTAFAAPLPTNAIARGKVLTPKVLFKPPAGDKRPDRTVGAGSRGRQCSQDIASASMPSGLLHQLPLRAVVPTANAGLTVAERPVFWVYLPQTSAQKIVLSVQKEDASEQTQWIFPVPETSGIFSFQPPADAPPLKVGETYQWAVVLVCGERPNPNDPAIAAWVKRVSPSQLPSQPASQETPLDQIARNADQGLWYDMVTALAQERKSQPNDPTLTQTWADVLKPQGLEPIVSEPLRF